MNPGVVKVDSLTIQQTMSRLADMIADLGPSWGKVRDDISTPGTFINTAIRNPVRMDHLKEIDRYLKELAQELQTMLSQPPNKETEHCQMAMSWVEAAYEDVKAAITR